MHDGVMSSNGLTTDRTRHCMASFRIKLCCAATKILPSLFTPTPLRDTNRAGLPWKKNRFYSQPVAKSHCDQPRFPRKTSTYRRFEENPIAFHFMDSFSLLLGRRFLPNFQFRFAHAAGKRFFPECPFSSSLYLLLETVVCKGLLSENLKRIWQRCIFLFHFGIQTLHALRENAIFEKTTYRNDGSFFLVVWCVRCPQPGGKVKHGCFISEIALAVSSVFRM